MNIIFHYLSYLFKIKKSHPNLDGFFRKISLAALAYSLKQADARRN
jgi:hypothetical protein